MKQQYKNLIIVTSILCMVVAGFWSYRISTNDCTSLEKYDTWRDECYFECESDYECSQISSKIEDELNQEFNDSKSIEPAKLNIAPKIDHQNGLDYTSEQTGTETKGNVYTVQVDGSLSPTPSIEHNEIWKFFKNTIGEKAVTQSLLTFEVFNDNENPTAASVWQSSTDTKKWHMNINESYRDDKKDFVHTMIHEYAHILTLSGDQVSQISGSCPRLELSEGCAKDNSYIQAFQLRFWNKYGSEIPSPDNADEEEVAVFYKNNKNNFVGEYAATNVTEDMAESFAHFVLRPKPQLDGEINEKINFYYEYPELVELRNRMRASIGVDLLRRERSKQ